MKMKTPLSPSDIEVLLHCHVSPSRHPRSSAPAVAEAVVMFRDAGLVEAVLEQGERPGLIAYHRTTPKGDAFVKALCNTPEPVQAWTVPATPKGE